MKAIFATISKTGARLNNEDYLHVIDSPEDNRLTGIVCDGMGGHAYGEVASETVCTSITRFWEKHADLSDCDIKVQKACQKASEDIDRTAAEKGIHEMGTTMVMASIEDNTATIAHVGDSRCYVQRPGKGLLHQTKDHTVQKHGRQMVAKCFFTGHSTVSVPDIKTLQLQAGDRILLCSDGLYGPIEPSILLDKMMEERPLEDILDEYDTMCDRDGHDNYSAILIELA